MPVSIFSISFDRKKVREQRFLPGQEESIKMHRSTIYLLSCLGVLEVVFTHFSCTCKKTVFFSMDERKSKERKCEQEKVRNQCYTFGQSLEYGCQSSGIGRSWVIDWNILAIF
jgi:hypothetical protein